MGNIVGDPQLRHQIIKIKQLVDDYRSSRIVIPELQRDYVWKPNRAPHLSDSLCHGYPISSLLLWQSSEDTRARRRDPRPSRAGQISWLIDGQQRAITLARTLNGDEGIDVGFHLDEEGFQLVSAATRKDRSWVRVAELWDDEPYRQLRRNLENERGADEREQRVESAKLDFVGQLRLKGGDGG